MHHFNLGFRIWDCRFISIPNLNSQIPNQDVSETQMAECRSSKPDVAGSIPVAHSNNCQSLVVSCQLQKRNLATNNWPLTTNRPKAHSFNRQNSGLQNRSSQFESECACQINLGLKKNSIFPQQTEERRDFFKPHNLIWDCGAFLRSATPNLKSEIKMRAWRNGISAIHYEWIGWRFKSSPSPIFPAS